MSKGRIDNLIFRFRIIINSLDQVCNEANGETLFSVIASLNLHGDRITKSWIMSHLTSNVENLVQTSALKYKTLKTQFVSTNWYTQLTSLKNR